MSVVFTLTSAAILAGITLSSATTIAIIDQVSDGVMDINEPIETMFNDCELLEKTLLAHGCGVKVVSENEIIVETQCGNMRYVRENSSLSFGLLLDEISNPDELFDNLKSFEVDYGRNVQAYTYNHIKENLTDGMSIDEEVVMEDDSLFLTINID